MSLFTVTITGITNPIEVYGGLSACKDYLGSSSSSAAVAFNAIVASGSLSADDLKSQKLVDATRYIDAQSWQGAADAFGGTTLQWPRTGIMRDSVTLTDAQQLAIVAQAAFELAGLFASDSDLAAALDSGSNIESMGAGSARLQFFRPTSVADGTATALPVVVSRLLGRWLATASGAISAASAGIATGTSCRDDFSDCAEDKLRWPL